MIIYQIIIMEQVKVVHNCVLFKINEIRYIYGLTYSYILSSKMLKYKPNYLILPSLPYTNQMFMHFGVDQILAHLQSIQSKGIKPTYTQPLVQQFCKCLKAVVIKDKQILYKYKYQSTASPNFIQLFSDEKHKIIQQQQLIRIHLFHVASLYQPKSKQNIFQNLKEGSLGAPFAYPRWLSQPFPQLKLIVNKEGNTTFLCLGLSLICLDPSQQILHSLKMKILEENWRILLDKGQLKQQHQHIKKDPQFIQLLSTIIITRRTSIPSILTLLLATFYSNAHKAIRVIVVNSEIEKLLLEFAERFLHMPECIIRQRLWIRILEPNITFPLLISNSLSSIKNSKQFMNNDTTNLTLQFCIGDQKYYPHLNIYFGAITNVKMNKCVTFYGVSHGLYEKNTWSDLNLSEEIEIVTFKKLPENIDKLEYIVVNKIDEQLEKTMKSLPVLLRKKVVYNRLQHKYNHKYFVTFGELTKIQPQQKKSFKNIELLTGPRHSKKFGQNTQNNLDHNEVLKQFILNQNLQDYNVFEDSYSFGDYVTIFNNYALSHKNLSMNSFNDKKTKNSSTIHKLYNDCIFQNANTQQKFMKQFSDNISIGPEWKIYILQPNEKLNTQLSVVYIISGMCILYHQQSPTSIPELRLLKKNQLIVSHKDKQCISIIISIKQCTLGLISSQNFRTYHPKYYPFNQSHHKDILSDIGNSFLSPLRLSAYQFGILNKIGKKQTYEVGNKINYNKNQKVFFIVKGGVKWNYEDRVANTGYFIGDLLQHYKYYSHHEYLKLRQIQLKQAISEQKKLKKIQESEVERDDKSVVESSEQNQAQEDEEEDQFIYIEVIKDTWVIEFDIEEFHENFLKPFAQNLYYIYANDQVFH